MKKVIIELVEYKARIRDAAPEMLEALTILELWRSGAGNGSLKGIETIIDEYVLPVLRKMEGKK